VIKCRAVGWIVGQSSDRCFLPKIFPTTRHIKRMNIN
jgi:hypothetical protein